MTGSIAPNIQNRHQNKHLHPLLNVFSKKCLSYLAINHITHGHKHDTQHYMTNDQSVYTADSG